jgi:sodium/bile acid cotransporter 7
VAWIKAHINTANVSSFCILLLVWLTFCNTFGNSTVRTVSGRDVAGTVFLNVALFILFVVVCFVVAWPPPPLQALRRVLRLRRPDAVAVVICGSTKTVAMGVPLISVMYKQVPYAGLLALPLIVYHALQVLLGGLMLEPLKKWCLAGDAGDQAAAGGGEPAGGKAGATGPVAEGGGGSGAPSEADAGDGDSSRRSGSSRWSLLPHRLRRGGGGDAGAAPSSSSAGAGAGAAV